MAKQNLIVGDALNVDTFIKKNNAKWAKLAAYNAKISKSGMKSLPKEEIREFTELFRLCSHHLSYSNTHFPSSKTGVYLNQLVSISHNYFYTPKQTTKSEALAYFTYTFPQKVRENQKYLWFSIAVFFVGFLFSMCLVFLNPETIYYFLPKKMAETLGTNTASRDWNAPIVSAYIMSNNILVTLKALSYGILCGVGTIYILFYNGLILGSLTAFIHTSGSDFLNYTSLILPHGFLELTAIFLGGSGGLLVGKSILMPGNMTRKHSVIKAGKEMGILIPGVAVMLVLAGLIEGFFTPLPIPAYTKILFSFATLACIVCYFALVGTKPKP